MQTAGQMLLFHASAVMAATAARKAGHLADLPARLALSALVLGAALFAADLARRGFSGAGLFPMAAPTGGWLMLGAGSGLPPPRMAARRDRLRALISDRRSCRCAGHWRCSPSD